MNKCIFNKEEHSYTYNDKKLISVTQLMQKHNLAPNYGDVDVEVLERAAARGTEIHKAIENYITLGFECVDSNSFQRYIEANNILVLQNEYLVHNDICAGQIDLILAESNGTIIIADIKTTCEVHRDSISWQLSLYRELLGNQYNIERGQCIHINKRTLELEVIDISLKPREEVLRLLDCERKGTLYESFNVEVNNTIQSINELELAIKGFKQHIKEAEAKQEALKNAIMEYMKQTGTYKIQTDALSISYIPEGTRKSLDQTKLKDNYPDVYELCQKESITSEQLRITIRKDKKND